VSAFPVESAVSLARLALIDLTRPWPSSWGTHECSIHGAGWTTWDEDEDEYCGFCAELCTAHVAACDAIVVELDALGVDRTRPNPPQLKPLRDAFAARDRLGRYLRRRAYRGLVHGGVAPRDAVAAVRHACH
jgi:hypothetical protein